MDFIKCKNPETKSYVKWNQIQTFSYISKTDDFVTTINALSKYILTENSLENSKTDLSVNTTAKY